MLEGPSIIRGPSLQQIDRSFNQRLAQCVDDANSKIAAHFRFAVDNRTQLRCYSVICANIVKNALLLLLLALDDW